MARSITVIPAAANGTTGIAEIPIQRIRMAAYCRVSTDQEEQLLSYENQVGYYETYIKANAMYEYAGVYADEGITGTSTKKRDEFKRMIKDCEADLINMIIVKSISRFARNTLDCLNYVRKLKELGIGVIFEKENINTLDAKGEVLLTILSSLAQDESRSISENSQWGIHRRFEQGKFHLNTTKFLGYDKEDEDGNMVINPMQAEVVKTIYRKYMEGKTVDLIARELAAEGCVAWNGTTKWLPGTIQKILMNEKYKGDALLQKSYTVDFLSKKRKRNDGQIPQYYVEDSHPAIIDQEYWGCVQLEFERRKTYMEEHGLKAYSVNTENNPFSGKIICGECGGAFGRKCWMSSNGPRKVWQCNERYREKGKTGCNNRHVDDNVFEKAFMDAWNAVMVKKEHFIKKWKSMAGGEDKQKAFKAKQLLDLVEQERNEFNIDFMLKVLEFIAVYETGILEVKFVDGTKIECVKAEQ